MLLTRPHLGLPILEIYPMIARYPGRSFREQVAAFDAGASEAERSAVWELLGLPGSRRSLVEHLGGIEVRRRGSQVLFTYSPELAFARDYEDDAAPYPVGWNRASLPCRGLIAREEPDGSLRLLCRPFPKFFNLNEVRASREAEIQRLMERGWRAEVAQKLDGSLGLIFWDDEAGRWRLTTRGSLDSEQGVIGERLLYSLPHWKAALSRLNPAYTYTVEIIHPKTRVVVNYGDLTELFLIRVIHNRTGYILTDRQLWEVAAELGVPTTTLYPGSLADVMAERAHLPGDQDEGAVLLLTEFEVPLEALESGDPALRLPEQRMVKVKWASYLEIHKALSFLMSPRAAQNAVLASIQATLGCGKPGVLPWDDFARAFPPDKLPEVQQIADRIWSWREQRIREAEAWRDRVLAGGPYPDRKSLALAVQSCVPPAWQAPVFGLLSGKGYEPLRPPCRAEDIFDG